MKLIYYHHNQKKKKKKQAIRMPLFPIQPLPLVFVISPPLLPSPSICQLDPKGVVWSENIKGTPCCYCCTLLCSRHERDLSLTDHQLSFIQTGQRWPLESWGTLAGLQGKTEALTRLKNRIQVKVETRKTIKKVNQLLI